MSQTVLVTVGWFDKKNWLGCFRFWKNYSFSKKGWGKYSFPKVYFSYCRQLNFINRSKLFVMRCIPSIHLEQHFCKLTTSSLLGGQLLTTDGKRFGFCVVAPGDGGVHECAGVNRGVTCELLVRHNRILTLQVHAIRGRHHVQPCAVLLRLKLHVKNSF